MRKALILALAVMLGGLTTLASRGIPAAHAVTAATAVTVTPATMNGWYFYDDTNDSTATTTGNFVNGPATPPLGIGSAHLTIGSTPNDRHALFSNARSGTRIDALTALSYASYEPGPTYTPSLTFDIKYRPGDTSYGGRLTFEPYMQGAVGAGWQTWSPLSGVWWASKDNRRWLQRPLPAGVALYLELNQSVLPQRHDSRSTRLPRRHLAGGQLQRRRLHNRREQRKQHL